MLKRKVRLKGDGCQIPIGEALIRALRDLALSGDRRALALQRRILDEAGLGDREIYDPEEIRRKVIDAFRKMGVKIVNDGAAGG